MPFRRLLAVVLAIAIAVPYVFLARVAQSGGIPSSIGLVYFKKKNFKVGDWVLYKVSGTSQEGKSSVDYQRIQAALEERFQGEPCVWIETGFGPAPDSLDYSAALLSENAYDDSIADLRANFYMRKIHMSTDEDGTPRAFEVRTFNPKIPLSEADFLSRRPEVRVVRPDTLDTPKGRIPCTYIEMVRTHTQQKANPDVTVERGVESTVKRWINPDFVPITGILREEEHKVYKQRAWPVGKPSTDYPVEIAGYDDLKTELVEFGHGAKPRLADRMKDSRDGSTTTIAP